MRVICPPGGGPTRLVGTLSFGRRPAGFYIAGGSRFGRPIRPAAMPLRDLCGIGICSRLAPAANVRFARVATISTAHAAFNGAGSGVRMGRGDTRSIRFDMRKSTGDGF